MPSIHDKELTTATALVAEEDDKRGYKILEYHLTVKNAKGGEEVSSGTIVSFDGDDDMEFRSGIAEDKEGVLYVSSRFTRSMIEGEPPKVVLSRFTPSMLDSIHSEDGGDDDDDDGDGCQGPWRSIITSPCHRSTKTHHHRVVTTTPVVLQVLSKVAYNEQ